MLGHVVEQRRRTRRACAARVSYAANNSPKPAVPASCANKNACTVKNASGVIATAPPAVTALRQNNNNSLPPSPMRKKKKVLEESQNQRITDFFPVRRSNRKTSKQIEEEVNSQMEEQILTGCNEKLLEVYSCPIKGRGIRAGARFVKNQFVVEYKGELMDYSEAKEREQEYAQDPQIGSYMYFFHHKNRRWCIDATEDTGLKGRLVNHSALRPNLKTKVVEVQGKIHLILIGKRDIEEGEELLYDYGDRTPLSIAQNPWLVNS